MLGAAAKHAGRHELHAEGGDGEGATAATAERRRRGDEEGDDKTTRRGRRRRRRRRGRRRRSSSSNGGADRAEVAHTLTEQRRSLQRPRTRPTEPATHTLLDGDGEAGEMLALRAPPASSAAAAAPPTGLGALTALCEPREPRGIHSAPLLIPRPSRAAIVQPTIPDEHTLDCEQTCATPHVHKHNGCGSPRLLCRSARIGTPRALEARGGTLSSSGRDFSRTHACILFIGLTPILLSLRLVSTTSSSRSLVPSVASPLL